jgi:hypothetical protein
MEAIRQEFKAVFEGLKESPGQPSSVISPYPDTWSLRKPLPQFPQFLGLPRSVNFVGQAQQLRALELKLEVDAQPPERKLRAVVMHGLGGIGKTHLANEFTHRHRTKYDACYWVTADTPIKLAQGFEDIAQLLHIEETDHAQVRASVIDWLCKTGKR